jgi:hypothetical protein
VNLNLEKQYKVSVDYLKLRCACGNSWGIGFFGKDQLINPKDLMCSKCALEEKVKRLS